MKSCTLASIAQRIAETTVVAADSATLPNFHNLIYHLQGGIKEYERVIEAEQSSGAPDYKEIRRFDKLIREAELEIRILRKRAKNAGVTLPHKITKPLPAQASTSASMETAAKLPKWIEEMTPAAKKAYLKAHPDSKYAAQLGGGTKAAPVTKTAVNTPEAKTPEAATKYLATFLKNMVKGQSDENALEKNTPKLLKALGDTGVGVKIAAEYHAAKKASGQVFGKGRAVEQKRNALQSQTEALSDKLLAHIGKLFKAHGVKASEATKMARQALLGVEFKAPLLKTPVAVNKSHTPTRRTKRQQMADREERLKTQPTTMAEYTKRKRELERELEWHSQVPEGTRTAAGEKKRLAKLESLREHLNELKRPSMRKGGPNGAIARKKAAPAKTAKPTYNKDAEYSWGSAKSGGGKLEKGPMNHRKASTMLNSVIRGKDTTEEQDELFDATTDILTEHGAHSKEGIEALHKFAEAMGIPGPTSRDKAPHRIARDEADDEGDDDEGSTPTRKTPTKSAPRAGGFSAKPRASTPKAPGTGPGSQRKRPRKRRFAP